VVVTLVHQQRELSVEQVGDVGHQVFRLSMAKAMWPP
jgi:hypothetical protein